MAVSYVAVGTGVDSSGTTLTVGTPGGTAPSAGDMIIALVAFWNSTRTPPTLDEIAVSSGWQVIGDTTGTDGGGGSYGLDTGPRDVAGYWKVSDGTETSVAFDLPSDTGQGTRGYTMTFAKSLAGWESPISIAGADSTDGTAMSATPSGDYGTASANGDMLAVGVVNRPDTATQGSPAITYATGTYTQRASGAATAGHDARHNVGTFAVTGASSGAPTFTTTLSAAGTGSVLFVRLRESTAVSVSTTGKAGASRGRIVAGSVLGESVIGDVLPPAGRAAAPPAVATVTPATTPGRQVAARAAAAPGTASSGASAADGHRIYIGFNAGVSATPTWTEVTDKVQHNPGISINHWRRDETSQVDRSSLSLTLYNDDGRFTPGNTSSPYYPNVKRRRRVKVETRRNGVIYPRFTGYVDDWGVDWPEKIGGLSMCDLSASSRMAVLGAGSELRSITEEEILASTPFALYTLGEPVEATSVADTTGNSNPPLLPAGSGADVTFGTEGSLSGSGLTVATFAAGRILRAGYDATPAEGAVAVFFKTTTASTPILYAGVNAEDLLIQLNGSGRITLGGGGSPTAFTSTGSYHDGEWHHLAASRDGATWSVYADGVLLGTVGATWSTVGAPSYGMWLALGASAWSGAPSFTGSLALAAIWDAPLSADDVDAIAEAGSTGFASETPTERLARYAAFAGISTADLNLDTGQVPDLANIDTTGMTALTAMRAIEETEGGVLFDALDGTLTFHDRAHRYGAASAFTLSYTDGHIANAIRPVLDDQAQVNDMTCTNADGVTGRQFDELSIDDHGLYRDGKTLHTTDPDEPLLRASWVVNQYAEPLVRVSEVEVNVTQLSNALAAAVLSAQVGTMFTITNLPSNAPSSTMRLFIEGRTDRITMEEDRIIFRTSPAEIYDVFTFDDPSKGLDSGYPLAY